MHQTIPSSVKILSKGSFKLCSSLNTVRFLSSKTKMDCTAFIGCNSLMSIEIPESLDVFDQIEKATNESFASIAMPMTRSIDGNAVALCIVDYVSKLQPQSRIWRLCNHELWNDAKRAFAEMDQDEKKEAMKYRGPDGLGETSLFLAANASQEDLMLEFLEATDEDSMEPHLLESPRSRLPFEHYACFEAKRKAVTEAEGKTTETEMANDDFVRIIKPTECKLMISFNDRSAGEDAEKLANYLTSNGHDTCCTRLFCPQNPGSWREATVNGAVSCKYYVMLLTNGWQKSNECQYETKIVINRWAKNEVKLIPVWYKDFDEELDTNGNSDHKPKHYSIQFQSVQSMYQRTSDNWMQDILTLLE